MIQSDMERVEEVFPSLSLKEAFSQRQFGYGFFGPLATIISKGYLSDIPFYWCTGCANLCIDDLVRSW